VAGALPRESQKHGALPAVPAGLTTDVVMLIGLRFEIAALKAIVTVCELELKIVVEPV
jgi:hypothetical protein